jgi:hypothetical protein
MEHGKYKNQAQRYVGVSFRKKLAFHQGHTRNGIDLNSPSRTQKACLSKKTPPKQKHKHTVFERRMKKQGSSSVAHNLCGSLAFFCFIVFFCFFFFEKLVFYCFQISHCQVEKRECWLSFYGPKTKYLKLKHRSPSPLQYGLSYLHDCILCSTAT